jgi:outer membrane receptor protein involved in Fe transport
MPSANIQYSFANDTMGYVSYSNAFKAGGYSVSFDRISFKPEYADSFELGLKGSALDHRLTYGVALFDSLYKDLQLKVNLLENNIPINVVRNAARVESRGVEGSVSWRMSHYLTLHTDAAYLDAKFKDYADAPCSMLQALTFVPTPANPVCAQDLSGSRSAFAPKVSGNLRLHATMPLSHDTVLSFDPSVYFTSGFYQGGTNDPQLYQGSYTKVDVRAGIGSGDGRWELALIGRNLGNKLTASYRNTTAASDGSVVAFPEAPRNIALQFAFRH